VGELLDRGDDEIPLGNTIFFVGLLTLIVTLYDATSRTTACASSAPRSRSQSAGPCSASQALATRFWARVSQASTTRSASSSRSSRARSGMRTSTAG
jgi:hypothetical protein